MMKMRMMMMWMMMMMRMMMNQALLRDVDPDNWSSPLTFPIGLLKNLNYMTFFI